MYLNKYIKTLEKKTKRKTFKCTLGSNQGNKFNSKLKFYISVNSVSK